ncbi:hypothetical protein C8J56DRAFT_910325 [Mycena floridula]|nr:hypothetical protein C8J56DRAFT_910325 [Mycena floridula]
MAATPAWQTDELQDEWVDQDDDSDDNFPQSISLTAPLASEIHTNLDDSDSEPPSPNPAVGTFLVHQSVAAAPLLPRTPGQAKNKRGNIKDFFSPLPLERLFEPPSPPPAQINLHQRPEPAQASDEILETDLPNMVSFDGRKPSLGCQFTFQAPRDDFINPNPSAPQAQSTPCPPPSVPSSSAHPTTDPPLRLFQFQYDTFTRDHLSAMVDSIAVNTPSGSGTTPSPTTFTHALSRVSEATGSHSSFSHLRSSKRVKLSPSTDYAEGVAVSIARPRIYGKDYVGASQSLMQQIREARDFSTISTTVSAQQTPSAPQESKYPGNLAANAGTAKYSSSKYREQAAALMQQIKNDMKGQKRIFSGTTDSSESTQHDDTPGDKENYPQLSLPSSSRSSSLQSSPSRKSYREISQGRPPRRSYTIDQDIVDAASKLSFNERHPLMSSVVHVEPVVVNSVRVDHHINPTLLNPSLINPTSSVRSGPNEDLNRFVSSSTASGTTTLTAGSAPSFVKHAGPVQIRTIAPSDVPVLPERLGNMFFDKVMMKWVKSTAHAAAGRDDMGEYLPVEDASEDPFEDIESLRDDSRVRDGTSVGDDTRPHELSVVEEHTEMDDEEEMELTSFETDNPTARIVDVMTGVETDDDETTDSEDNPNDPLEGLPIEELGFESEDDPLSPDLPSPPALSIPAMTPLNASPLRGGTTPSTTPMKSALKSHSATPTSVMKYRTPLRRNGHRRSVSFSDGKRDGPIQGLSRDPTEDSPGPSFVPSVRSKRIADMMDALDDSDSGEDESPSKSYSATGRPEEMQPLSGRQQGGSKRVFSRSQSHKPSPGTNRSVANATFLTECSFGVAHDQLVQVITDVEPFEPHWEQLTCIDLSGKHIESAARLKEFLPSLDTLNMNSNQLSWLSGVPGSVRTLSVASNSLTSVTSFNHLKHLVSLDISKNQVDSINQLRCLRHLRELRADSNKITQLEGLEAMDALVKLSLQGNKIRAVDLSQYRWGRLEMLNLSHNCLDNLSGLDSLASLIALNIDHNAVGSLEIKSPMPRLKILRASGNRLTKLNLSLMPNLRTLYLDNNSLTSLVRLERLTKLENLSLRNQSGRGLNLLARDVRDVKRLYLSGNPLGNGFLSEACYNLLYVELAACRLSSLPDDLAQLIPNVRPLEGLTRLRKLTIIGSRLQGTKGLIRLLQRMPDLEMLDFRMNPCTLGWYLPLMVRGVPGALQPSENQNDFGDKEAGWLELDSKFRRDLPDDVYVGRLAYRGLVMKACPRLRMLDGIEVAEKERIKAQKLLVGILGKRPR